MTVRPYTPADLAQMLAIWNGVVAEGQAFPQEQLLTPLSGAAFFAGQSRTAVAEANDGRLAGLYILHPNNVGRCGHIANASYAVLPGYQGQGVGRQLVEDSLRTAAALGFGILQFNAVVATNAPALALYKKLGFVQLGIIPGGFRLPGGGYADIIPHYKLLG